MTKLTFHIFADRAHHMVDITDWRYMTSCVYLYGESSSTGGSRIIITDGMIDVMGYSPGMLLEAMERDEDIDNVVFSHNYGLLPGWCRRCGGEGKLDWISLAMATKRERHYGNTYAKLFKRDKKRILLYLDSTSSRGYRNGHFFASTITKGGETICKHCSGTGLNLDARHSIFRGMGGLRDRLKAFEWDGFNIPTIKC
jgi:hypothetical protein